MSDELYRLLVERGYPQHEAHAIASMSPRSSSGASGCGHVPAGYSCVTPGCSNGPAPEPSEQLVEAMAELIYLRKYGKDGARWELNESKDVWRTQARAALGSVSSEPRDEYVAGWAIEGAWSPTDQPEYWAGSSAWSTDPYKALRFATQPSAQQAANLMLDGINYRICAHEWADSPETKDEKHG